MKQNTDELVKLVEELRQLAQSAGFWKAHSIFTRLASALESLSAELQSARKTITRLNRRAQTAEKAAESAHECIRKVNNGAPWCGGNLGRALLAYHCGKLEEKLQSAERVVEAARMAKGCGVIANGERRTPCIRCRELLYSAVTTHDCKYPAATKSEAEESR